MDTKSGSMHVVMVPWLAFGHILPFTELAKRIAQQGHRVTLLSTPRNTRRLIRIPPDLAGLVRVVDVALPRVDGLPEDAEASIDLTSVDLRPYLFRAWDAAFAGNLSDLLQEPEPWRPDWVLIDYAAHWAPAAAARHGYANRKAEQLTAVPDYVPFPTIVRYRGYEAWAKVKLDLMVDDSGVSEGYRFAKCIEESQLVGVRSSMEFEPEWLQLVAELYKKPVIPAGLFPPPPTQDLTGHEETLRWLEMQAPGSVVYAAFGSEAKLTSAQLHTIALGLEASGLPGLVCRGWVPQVTFLEHASVGGFLTHAGWNSITEGLANGVRLVLLPMVFEQGINARHMVEKKIGIEVARDGDDGSFTAEDIAAALRRVMVEEEGEELRVKVKELTKVFGNDEVNDQCVRDFLRCLKEHSRRDKD
ncbi:hypothetical protein EJB05_18327, partial [Eragrostis curvula]